MKKIILSKFVCVFVLLIVLLPCVANGQSQKINKSETSKNSIVMVSTTHKLANFPNRVIPYGDRSLLTLSDLKINRTSSNISGSLKFSRKADNMEEIKLVGYFSNMEQLLLAVFSLEMRRIFVTPAGSDWNTVRSPVGYSLKNQGEMETIEFDLPISMPGTYNLGTSKGKLYIFCLGAADEPIIKRDAFAAVSNVLEIEIPSPTN